jgi:hypothetical protein
MKKLQLSDRLLVLISENNTHNWPITEEDKALKFRKAFITYLGGEKSDLVQLKESLKATKIEIRKGKRLPYEYELKIWGLSWDFVRYLPQKLAQVGG